MNNRQVSKTVGGLLWFILLSAVKFSNRAPRTDLSCLIKAPVIFFSGNRRKGSSHTLLSSSFIIIMTSE